MTKSELYEKLMAADDLSKALVDNFSFLADSDGFMSVLEAVMKKVKSVEFRENDGYGRAAIYLLFPGRDENELICGEIETRNNYSMYPPSFKKIVATCMYVIFPDDGGWAIQLGSDSISPDRFKDDELSKCDGRILSPLRDFSDRWIYHPTRKNPQGEPLLCLVSHGDMEIVKAVSCNIGSLFLKRIAEHLKLKGVVPDVAYPLK